MKKVFDSSTASKISVFGLIFALTIAPVFAEAPDLVGVFGKVTGPGGNVSGADVEVICGDLSDNTTTNGGGSYYVTFNQTELCHEGTIVTVNASKEGLSGSNTSAVAEDPRKAKVDVFISANEVPEFGLITGAVAGLASAGSYLALKRRSKKA
ncbi:hypothetical protein C4561_00150 [candidate division WWE3 bacterium]|jgi:hypothetical protein|uniref:Uncharacterized protein n=1 Tax=candidate division WWE3 bacterium TaxID=2053526 RepID=A0A3A4ZGP2_UNCKA|nr:MAG: hypothetical protein C4561_00150 [candidate division WWE3 bacterium]